MISLVIYGVIAISLASAAGYAYLTFTNTTKQATYVQENTVRLNSAVAAVRASLLPLNPGATGGILLAPAGMIAADGNHVSYTQLPPAVGAVGLSPWNQPYLYCPVSQTQASGLTSNALNTVATAAVQSPSGASYTVGTYTGSATAGVSYVISNTTTNAVPNSTGYVAFIVSSTGPGQTVPDCGQIVVFGNSVTVPRGVVRGVKADLPFKQRLAGASDRMEVYVSNQTTGDGTGRDLQNLTVLDYAMNLWLTLQPRQTDIYLTGGLVYAVNSNLDAEGPNAPAGSPSYPFAQAQGANLAIETLPGTATASVNLPNALVLTTPTAFVNLQLNAASTLITTAPLLLKNVTYVSSNSGTIFSIVGTSLSSQNSSFTNTTLSATNSSVEFYNSGVNTTYTNTQVSGTMSRFDFSAPSASTYTFTANGTGNYPISLSGSSMNVGANATLSVTNATDSVVLNASTLNVQGTLDLYGGAAFGALDAFGGSTVSIPASGTILAAQTAGAMPYGIFVRGSKVAIDGTLSTTGLNAGAIAIQGDGELTGTNPSGMILDAQPTRYPCLYLTNGANGSPVPVWLNATNNYPTFAEVQKGYQPMVGDIANATIASTNTIDTNAYGYLNQRSPINDPQVYNSTAPFDPTAPAGSLAGYVDPTTFERGTRDLVNMEWVTGVRLNFYGTCQS